MGSLVMGVNGPCLPSWGHWKSGVRVIEPSGPFGIGPLGNWALGSWGLGVMGYCGNKV